MARIRSVKPEFWDDRKLAKRASRDARLLYIALWNLADEWGRLNGDPQWIKGQVFSYDDDLDCAAIAKMLEELENPAIGAVVAYEADGDPYLFLPKLAKHQRLEPEKVRSRLPEPPAWASGPRDPGPPPAAPPPPSGQSESRAGPSESRTDESARRADKPEPHAKKPALLYVAGSMEHVAGGRDARAGARTAPPPRGSPLASQLLDEHTAACNPRPSRGVIAQVGRAIDELLDEPDIQAAEIRDGLARLRAKPRLGPGTLKNLVDEVRRERADPGLARTSPAPVDRRQQATDAQFDRAMQRAIARDEAT